MRLEEENKCLRQEKKDIESEMWKTQEGLRDEVRRLEDEVKSTSKKMRDAETKYVNLAATPPKVHVRTVQVVSEEMKRRLEETVAQNKKLEDLLECAKKEHAAKDSQFKELEGALQQAKMEYNSKVCINERWFMSVCKFSADYEHVLENSINLSTLTSLFTW